MKNGLLKVILLFALVFSLVMTLASCEIPDALDGIISDIIGSEDVGADDSAGGATGDGEEQKTPATDNENAGSGTTDDNSEAENGGTNAGENNNTGSGSGSNSGENGNVNNNQGGDNPDNDNTTDNTVVYNPIPFGNITIPAYAGKEWVTVNNNIPFFTADEIVTRSYEKYSARDSLGRCTVTMACLGKDLMPTEDRGNISSVYPTGWKQAYYSCVSGGALYNRCHLIAFQLSGENANWENLVTGTRTMNEAMIDFEDMVADYIKETNNHVMYRVTPVFEGDNLLCSGVLMEAYSVEDNGDAINYNVFIYNVEPEVIIDYATGESRLVNPENETEKAPAGSYVANKSSKKVHTADCANVDKMAEKNKLVHEGDLQELLDQGYEAAGCCKPT